jgi:ZIP family zinc transporter
VIELLAGRSPLIQTLLGTGVMWLATTAGAAGIFMVRGVSKRVMAGLLGFAAGVMLSASYGSLLVPAMEMVKSSGGDPAFTVTAGFLAGAGFIWILDKVLPHLHRWAADSEAEGIRTTWHKSALLILAITLHNIPEGLAVGVAFGALAWNPGAAALGGAVALAIGTAIQDVPEGLAVSAPLRGMGFSRTRSFLYGSLSGLVEPMAGVVGALTVASIRSLLPYSLAFSAGAMLYVIIEELIPESQGGGYQDTAVVGTIMGFALMTVLDMKLG